MLEITVANVGVRTDDEGRYCLNDLHRAAGSEKRHGPSYWLANQQTKELLGELATTGIPAVATIEGAAGGTFVAKELVYAYAMWISPAFHLKVIRAYDALVSKPTAPAIPQSLPEALRLAADLAEQKAQAEAALAIAAPKAEALDRIATANGSLCIRDAAKTLQVQEKALYQHLSANDWIYRRPMGSGWLAYSDILKRGLMEHKTETGQKPDGSEWIRTQPRITAKGMAKLAEVFIVKEAA